MKINGKEYRTIWFDEKNQTVKIIDQTKLPHQFIIKDLKTVKDAINAIKVMEVRGAPLIGGTAAYGIVLAIMEKNDLNFIKKSSEKLIQSRPTAINLKWAVDRMMKKLSGVNNNELLKVALDEAKAICEEDVKFCENIGLNGLKIIEKIYNNKKDTVNILTHCNAGALATVGYGTALGVIRATKESGKNIKVIVTETRPVQQGSRLTAFELKHDGFAVSLIPDTAVGYIMANKLVNKIVVGADRILRTGRVYNKIGTYQIATMAKQHNIPFYVAAPLSTFDLKSNPEDIIIEQRDSSEVTGIGDKKTAPDGIDVINPAFDMTPPELISGIITENGVAKPPYEDSIKKLFEAN